MKKCPNCGSEMEADVNFCTVCGTDLRNISAANDQENLNSQSKDSSKSNSVNKLQENETFSRVTAAVKNFDKDSLWNWFVTSWKTPSANQKGEKWYGIVTILIEMVLFIWGTVFGIKKSIIQITGINTSNNTEFQNNFNQVFHSLTIDLFLAVFLLGAGVVVGSYFAHKFVNEKSPAFLDYTNKIVQLSNINAIVVLAVTLLSFIDYKGLISIISLLALFAGLLFLIAGAVSICEGHGENRDSFWGVIIYVIIMLVVAGVVCLILKNQVISQAQTIFGNFTKSFFNY